MLSKPFVSTILIGAAKTHQLKENLGAADLKLSQEDVQTLDELTQVPVPYPAWMQNMGFDEKVKEALGTEV